MSVRVITGDCREVLPTLPADSFDCVVTSPPYFGLRDYQVNGQIGLEPTLGEYLETMVDVFRELRRVLKPTGTCWLNIGDSYAGSWGAQSREHAGKHAPNVSALSANQVKAAQNRVGTGSLSRTAGLKAKDLCMVPNRLAIMLQDDGWWVRSEIIWAKPNPMPESVTDRPTCAHEKVWLLTKSARYFYDAAAIAEQSISDHKSGNGYGRSEQLSRGGRGAPEPWDNIGGARNARNVWTFPSEPSRGVYLDFRNADYVDDHGTPRKLSPDCPVHGPHGQPRPGSRGGVSDGELASSPSSSSQRTDNGRDSSLTVSGVPTENYTETPPADIQQTKIPRNIGGSKIHATAPDVGEARTLSDMQDTRLTLSAPTLDCFPFEDAETAILNSKRTRKMGHDPLSAQHGRVCEETPWSTPHTSREHEAAETPPARMPESKIEALQPFEHETRSVPFRQEPRISRKQYDMSSTNNKCVCAISQHSHFAVMPSSLAERCIKAGCPHGGSVLDPFGGAGTTGLVADRLGRHATLIELNPANREMAAERVTMDGPLFAEVSS